MNHDKFNDTISALLEEGRVNYVIQNLRSRFQNGEAAFPELSPLISELEKVSDEYGAIRQFIIAGNGEWIEPVAYRRIKSALKDLGRRYLFIINGNRPDPLFAEYRLQKLRGTSLADLFSQLEKIDFRIEMARETEVGDGMLQKKREEIVDAIFRRIWSMPPASGEAYGLISSKLLSDSVSFEVKAQIVSAILLALLKFFDPSRFMLLLEAYGKVDDERLEARLLTAVVLILNRWGDSALATDEIRESLQSLEDSIMTYTRLRDVILTLVRTRDTDRVSKEVNEAFSKTMKEITPEMLEKLRQEGMSVDASEMGMNPEWEKLMKNKDIEEKMQAINDMQLEGMDVMMQTFARLKHFSFFRSVSNWFLPFTIDHSAVAPLFESFSRDGLCTMADATEMCSGDRFSFVLGILQMPEAQRNMLAANVGASLDMLQDQIKDRENVRRRSLFATEALSFARDLYRFAKVYPRKDSFYDPFKEPLDFLQLPVLGSIVNETEFTVSVADFYFKHKYYPLALPLYENASASGSVEGHIFEKIGYCHQMMSNYFSAVEAYEKADLFSTDSDPSSVWLLKRLAFCNKALGRYDNAADYYRKVIERSPDDSKAEFHLASVLLRMGAIKEAKEIISKIHYLDPENRLCERLYTRLKAHETFVNGKYNEALSLYEKARGDQDKADYRRDLLTELHSLYPAQDLTLMKILLDEKEA